MNEQGFNQFVKVAGPGSDQETPNVGPGMKMLIFYGLIGADRGPPSFIKNSGIAMVVSFASFCGSFYMGDNTVVDNEVPITGFRHSQAQVDIFTSVEKDFIKAVHFQKPLPFADAACCCDSTPFPHFILEWEMQEVLSIVPWVARWPKDNSHVIITVIVIPFLYIAHHPCIRVILKNFEHGSQPLSFNKDIVIKEA